MIDIRKAHADFVLALATRKPVPIPREPEPEDFTARAMYCEGLIEGVKAQLTALIDDAAENEPGNLIREAELCAAIAASLGDLKSDISGTFERIAERLREERYAGCPRGPFYRRRG
jgi:hypothetical protein